MHLYTEYHSMCNNPCLTRYNSSCTTSGKVTRHAHVLEMHSLMHSPGQRPQTGWLQDVNDGGVDSPSSILKPFQGIKL